MYILKLSLAAAGYREDRFDNALTEARADTNKFLNGVKHNLQHSLCNWWYKCINDSSRHPILRTYRLFKHEFCIEPYIVQLTNREYQKYVARFRVSSHNIRIQVGRHEGLPENQRICLYCNTGAIDNELHLMFDCTFHDFERKLLLALLTN